MTISKFRYISLYCIVQLFMLSTLSASANRSVIPSNFIKLYHFTNNNSNLYVTLNAYGRIVFGTYSQEHPWIWIKHKGSMYFPDLPIGYHYESLFSNKYGNLIAGSIVETHQNSRGLHQRLFYWEKGHSLKLLPDQKIVGFLSSVVFSRHSLYFAFLDQVPEKSSTNLSAQNVIFPILKWNRKHGYKRLAFRVCAQYKIVNISIKNYNAVVIENNINRTIGIYKETDHFIPLRNWDYGVPEEQNIVESPNNKIIAYNYFKIGKGWQSRFWNDDGIPLSFPAIPKDCSDFTVTTITNDGIIFSKARCWSKNMKYHRVVGFVTKRNHIETLKTWFFEKGKGDKVPMNTVVYQSNSDGSVLVGDTFEDVASGGGTMITHFSRKKFHKSDPSGAVHGFVKGRLFVAFESVKKITK